MGVVGVELLCLLEFYVEYVPGVSWVGQTSTCVIRGLSKLIVERGNFTVLLIALHYIWSVKSDLIQPLIYWTILLIILFIKREKVKKFIKSNKKTTKTLA